MSRFPVQLSTDFFRRKSASAPPHGLQEVREGRSGKDGTPEQSPLLTLDCVFARGSRVCGLGETRPLWSGKTGRLPLVSLCAFLYPLASGLEGMMVAARDGAFIAKVYVAMPVVTALAIAISRIFLGPVHAAWSGFAAFQAARLLMYGWRQRQLALRDSGI